MPASEPIRALSIRQPWSWLVCRGHKQIENRTWATGYRGPVLIHAGCQLASVDAQLNAHAICARLGIVLPRAVDCAGIVGIACIVDCVREHESPWFLGPYGFVLADARPLPFLRLPGRLGLWTPDLPPEYLRIIAET